MSVITKTLAVIYFAAAPVQGPITADNPDYRRYLRSYSQETVAALYAQKWCRETIPTVKYNDHYFSVTAPPELLEEGEYKALMTESMTKMRAALDAQWQKLGPAKFCPQLVDFLTAINPDDPPVTR